MNKDLFVQNVQSFCALKGVKPTAACKDSGVGTSFITDIRRGQTPSVAKVQLLAAYLGVTTSQLLGEQQNGDSDGSAAIEAAVDAQLISLLCQLSPQELAQVDAFVQGLLAKRAAKSFRQG